MLSDIWADAYLTDNDAQYANVGNTTNSPTNGDLTTASFLMLPAGLIFIPSLDPADSGISTTAQPGDYVTYGTKKFLWVRAIGSVTPPSSTNAYGNSALIDFGNA